MSYRSSHNNLVVLFAACISCVCTGRVLAQEQSPARQAEDPEALRRGRNFISTRVYELDDDRAVLKLFDGLRVADISDGMDEAGLADIGLASPKIAPLWKDT